MQKMAKGTLIAKPKLSKDFWKYWAGQTFSNLGSSMTRFVLPLLIYKLTGSALGLGLSTAISYLPYLLFGLFLGAWADRVDRKRMMIVTDIFRMFMIASIPFLALQNLLPVWWIYLVIFVQTTLAICFDAGQFTALPSLVHRDGLVAANGHIEASYSAAKIVGPLLGGVLITIMPFTSLLFIDAASFLLSSCSLWIIKTSFNESAPSTKNNIYQDVGEGLRYVFSHPILRSIATMMVLINFVTATLYAQLVLFAKEQLQASDFQLSVLYVAGSAGVIVLALLANPLRKRWSFSAVALGSLMLGGLFTMLFALIHWYWAEIPLWALISGTTILYNININSLRQTIVPKYLLGRVVIIARVLSWSAIPVGSLVGSFLVAQTKNITLIYEIIGILYFCIPLLFSFTDLRRADQYILKEELESI